MFYCRELQRIDLDRIRGLRARFIKHEIADEMIAPSPVDTNLVEWLGLHKQDPGRKADK